MSLRDAHVPVDRLTVLALGASESTNRDDQAALAHVSACGACTDRLARLRTELDGLREAAACEADIRFDDSALETQRHRILDRLAHFGQSARVLPFPGAPAARNFPSGSINRRWISAAAAAGLLIGMVAGQLVHFFPGDRRPQPAPTQQAARSVAPGIVQTRASVPVSDEELLGEIDIAVQRRRAPELAALDALTPTVSEIR